MGRVKCDFLGEISDQIKIEFKLQITLIKHGVND